ncbi:MAG: hypothetical protein EA388_11705 [Nitriliruptor sp.]|nr:MAG: hypothetical protein EA388_11705 [Nitriliruptor sp.]
MSRLARLLLVAAAALAVLALAPAASAPAHADDAFYLRNVNRGGAADITVRFGRADDWPLVGDWNGNRTTTVGVRRGSRFLLRNVNRGGAADLDFHYGRASDTPVVGDWNGDGTQTVGVRRGDRYFIRNRNSGGPADLDFHFGRADDVPIVGDWNGDGVETVGVRRGDTFYLRNSNSGGPADLVFRFGRAADLPLVGDWNANGTGTVGVRRVPPPPPPPPTTEIVSTFTTPLQAGQARNINISRALELIDGDVIAPGARYSLDSAIGPRTAERGFVPNGFISGGDLISVTGGGVSQVAVTVLNAAWFAGIDIVRFQPHSIYFPRYPMCREATISRGTIDLVLRNDSPHPITIRTSSTATSATVSFESRPWARVRSFTNSPTNIVGGVGGAFSVSCGRTITYPNGTSTRETYSWRYSEGYPG